MGQLRKVELRMGDSSGQDLFQPALFCLFAMIVLFRLTYRHQRCLRIKITCTEGLPPVSAEGKLETITEQNLVVNASIPLYLFRKQTPIG